MKKKVMSAMNTTEYYDERNYIRRYKWMARVEYSSELQTHDPNDSIGGPT